MSEQELFILFMRHISKFMIKHKISPDFECDMIAAVYKHAVETRDFLKARIELRDNFEEQRNEL